MVHAVVTDTAWWWEDPGQKESWWRWNEWTQTCRLSARDSNHRLYHSLYSAVL